MPSSMTGRGPHQGLPVRIVGEGLDRATAAMVMLHGRGATAEDILTLVPRLDGPRVAYLAPEADQNTWYPKRFSAPLENNEPWLESALAAVFDVVELIGKGGIPPERTLLLGFSQGACLTLEFAARNARRYGGVFAFTGALVGPPGTLRSYVGGLAGTPVFVGGSDRDVHVPRESMEETAQILKQLGGLVTMRFYPGLGHQVNQDEIDFVRSVMAQLVAV